MDLPAPYCDIYLVPLIVSLAYKIPFLTVFYTRSYNSRAFKNPLTVRALVCSIGHSTRERK